MVRDELRKELSKHRDRKYRINAQQFHKEKLAQPWVLRAPVARGISKVFYKRIAEMSKAEVLVLGDQLLESDIEARRFFAFDWAYRKRKDYAVSDFRTFERWLKRYVNNWGNCDHLCTGPLGELVLKYPELTGKVMKWTGAEDLYVRRAAAVTMIPSLRKEQGLAAAFEIAELLLEDAEDLVQKGYGWMLKEAGNQFPEEVFDFVMKHRARMPRTALRYAIEKYPPAMRKRAMNRK